LRVAGADVRLVPAVPFKDPRHYVHVARAYCEGLNERADGSAWFGNQFDTRPIATGTRPLPPRKSGSKRQAGSTALSARPVREAPLPASAER